MRQSSRLAALLLLAACQREQSAPVARAKVALDTAAFRDSLVRYGASDQAIRDTLGQMMQGTRALDTMVIHRMNRDDALRTTWLDARVREFGWPGRRAFGDSAATAAFLIVQHAVQDTAFQVRMLPLLEAAAAAGDASAQDVAMLSDRIAVKRGTAQVYGTQAQLKGGKVVLDPISDSAQVDARRARLGLPPLAEYVRVLEREFTSAAHATPAPAAQRR